MNVEFDRRTALVVVDVQNDFANNQGSLYVRGGEGIVPVVNREVSRAVAGGASVVYTQDWHPPSTPHFAKDGGIWPVHCVAGSWGAQFAAGLEVGGPVVRKGTGGEDGYSGFTVREPGRGAEHPTEMATLLRERGVERVVIVGLATDYCVKETALDALGAGFGTSVLTHGIRAVDLARDDGKSALEQMARSGVALISP